MRASVRNSERNNLAEVVPGQHVLAVLHRSESREGGVADVTVEFLPVSMSQRCSVRSWDADSARRPSGSTTTDVTAVVCPSKRRSSAPISMSHRRNVWSHDADSASSIRLQRD